MQSVKISSRPAMKLGAALLAFCNPLCRGNPNVILITIDDLRPELGCYGNAIVQTPHLDALAQRGTVFLRAYAQQALCAPSRASLFTGLRPDSTGVHDLVTHFRQKVPDVVTLPEKFKRHGYHAISIGKTYHPAFAGLGIGSDLGDAASWSEPAWLGPPRYYYSPTGVKLAQEAYRQALAAGPNAPNWAREVAARHVMDPREPGPDDWTKVNVRILATEAPEVDDEELYDGEVATRATAALRRLHAARSSGGQPFFLAVGFLKPHLPFVAPKRYWDLYDPAKLAPAPVQQAPKDAPVIALAVPLDELRDTYPKDIIVPAPGVTGDGADSLYDLPRGELSPGQQVNLLRGYYACVSFIDAQVGKILRELDHLGLADDTIIVVVGDHGFHLGHLGLWGKMTNFEDATRSPLIIVSPRAKSPGHHSEALVELVDVYPTLCELAGIDAPEHAEGVSLAHVLDDSAATVKSAAFSQYPRGDVMGYSLRTHRYRFTSWRKAAGAGEPIAEELYDHLTDPNETINLAVRPESKPTVVLLSQVLEAGWRGALTSSR